MRTLPLSALLLAACTGEKDDTAAPTDPPLGMILAEDGQLYAGAASMEITPTYFETYTDVNGNHQFEGCMTDPSGTRAGCEEPFDDADGDGYFDAAFIAGFQSPRPAQGVHDPLKVSAVVLSLDGEYLALVGIDSLGILENRVRDLRDLLEAEGFDRDRVVVSSSHAHSAPDTVGIWGMADSLITGVNPEFIATITPALYDVVTLAAASMEPVSPRQGLTLMSDDPTLNGEPFGGINPDPSVIGGLNDIRDPLIPADAVWSLALDGATGRVATVLSASGHPETSDSDHSLLSADFAGVARDWIEGREGGTAVFLSGSLGGMQSALGATLPKVDPSTGERLLEEDGTPQWDASGGGWDFMTTYGILVAQAAEGALTDSTPWSSLSVRTAEFLVPVDNVSFKLAFQVGLLDTPDDYIVQDASCPGYGTNNDLFGCVPTAAWQMELGPSTLASVPGELFPELFYGVPDEASMADGSARAGERRWVQWDADCAGVDDAECMDNTGSVGDCNCLQYHTVPYRISDTSPTPIVELLPGTFRQPVGIANAYCGYIVPTPDFNTAVSVLTDDGDHYEETNSCSSSFGDLILDAYVKLNP